jgi:hypothetical protein
MVAVLAAPGLLEPVVEDGSAGLAPRVPEVVSPGELLLPPQEELLEEADEVVLGALLGLLLLLLKDLELPLLLPPLDPRAKTSPQKETTKTKATISATMVRVYLHGVPCMVPS